MFLKSKKGFTLIELLVAIAILGLLSSMVLVHLKNAKASARDGERKGEVDSIRKALAFYYTEHGEYPESEEWISLEKDAKDNGLISQALAEWLPDMPEDPLWEKTKDNGEPFSYQYSTEGTEGQGYKIHSEMEGESYSSHETYSNGGGGIVYTTMPVANFTATPTSGNIPLVVSFTDTSVSGEEIIKWEWDFDNDSIIDSMAQNPMHIYAEAGEYTVNLTIYETDGDSDTEIKTDYITVEGEEINHPPFTPANPSPSNSAIDVSIDTVLSWTGGDPDTEDTVTYDVYFGTSAFPPLISENQLETSYNPGTLNYNTKYYWQITAIDNHGSFTEGDIWNFTTGEEIVVSCAGEWHFDEGWGDTTYDVSGNDNHGNLINNPAWIEGKLGMALDFNGENNYVDCGSNESLDISDAITIEAWIKRNTHSQIMYFIGNANNDGTRSQYNLGVAADHKLYFHCAGSSGSITLKGDIIIPETEWTHVAMVRESSSGTIKLYVNGTKEDQEGISDPTKIAIFSECGNTTIGKFGEYAFIGGYPFDGVIDEVKIWNGALSPEEINASYQAGL
ncbi:prepilin-type N-terminal cleavage/methylation domain-containing protein [Candidatus Parcubacteria bacterium]|nr:prepilin-type N-terminal cleavage/methylation domain-containing protein [Candidatus Parcubacteria bacterium]